MDCWVLPISTFRRRNLGSGLSYRRLTKELGRPAVKVVVGKEQREFLVDPFVLQENPFKDLIETNEKKKMKKKKRVVFVDVDALLFEHLLWLLYNDCSSLFQLNLKEIIDFYEDN